MAGGPGAMMFEHFTSDARTAVVRPKRTPILGTTIGCSICARCASAGEPAAAAREHGVTRAVEAEIVRLVGLGQAASLFSAADREALASIGIDLEAVRARIEAAFGADAFTRAAPDACRGNRPAWPKSPMARLRRRRRSHAAAGQDARPGAYPTGHLPFTPRAKKSLEHSLREAKARHDNYIGVEHLTLALVAMNDGAVPPILSALGASQATLRTAILDRYRQAN
jgi:hypothetical protein